MKCDQCLPGYHSLSSQGCVSCGCNTYGSNDSICNAITGQCNCLPGLRGRQCDQCPSNTLGPVRDGALVCIPCYCNGHTHQCESESGYYWSLVTSNQFNEWLIVNSQSSINIK